MKLTWLGHSCFLAEQGGYRILLDPYTGVEGYPSLLETASRAADWEQCARWEAKGGYTVTRKVRMTIVREGGEHQEFRLPVHKILCSHGHFDHNAVDQAEVVPFDGPCPFTIRTVGDLSTTARARASGGPNTIHILFGGRPLHVAHLGDLGHRLSPMQVGHRPPGRGAVPVGGTLHVGTRLGPRAVWRGLRPKAPFPVHYRHAPYGPARRAGGGGLPVPVARRGRPGRW